MNTKTYGNISKRNVQKGLFLFIFMMLVTGMAHGQKKYKLKPAQMTGLKTYMLSGNVSKVNYTNGDFIEFDTYGNVTRVQLDDNKAEHTYESSTRYKYHHEYYAILFNDNMRIEKWDNPNEHISTDYLFDVKGRIKEKRHNGYGDPFSYIYEYEGNSFLPFKLVYTSCWESGSVTITSLYEYTETDNKGNWTACKVAVTTETYDMDREEPEIKKDTKTYTRKIEYYTSEELKKGESYASEDTSSSGGIFAGKSFKRILLEILLVVLFLFAIGHMVYINFVRGARCGEYTIEYFQEQRKNKNLTPTSSAEENEQAWTLLNQAFLKWPVVESSDEQEYRKPKRMRHINAASAIIDQAIAFAPTDPEIVTRINELTDVINSNEERYFNGSKFLIGVAVVITLLMAYSSGETVRSIVSFGLGIAVYILASYTPAFLIEKRAKYGMGSVSNGNFAAVFSMIAGARTVRITTKWKDGREEVEDDYTQHWIAWFLGLFVIFVLGAFIIFWAILNYIRNYILYI